MAAIEKAYRYRDRLSDNERLTTEAGYYSYGPNPDLDKTIAAYEALLERDSLSSPALNNGGLRYSMKRDYVRAEQLLRRATAIPEPFGGSFNNLVEVQVAQGKFAAAESHGGCVPHHAALECRALAESTPSSPRGASDWKALEEVTTTIYSDPKATTQRDFSSLVMGQLSMVRGKIREGMRWHR